MKGVIFMSIHSEIQNNSPEKNFIKNLCNERWNKKKHPCKGCKYRYPIKDNLRCCMFPTVPRDWTRFENRDEAQQ